MRKHPVRVNHLGSDPIPQLVRRLALPAMLAQFVNVLYSIIDRMYIGNIANVGDIALAGVGICGPIVTMISAFAAWIGNGGAPLLSIKSGEQNTARYFCKIRFMPASRIKKARPPSSPTALCF